MNASASHSPRLNRGVLGQIIGLMVLCCALGYATIHYTVREAVEHQAKRFAEIVAAQATTARSVYSREVFAKVDASRGEVKGHLPIPSEFLKLVGRATSGQSAHLYEYKPVSRWNLEPSQGLSDDFLRWAWPQLEAQDRAHPTAPIAWKPVSRIETGPGGPVLRYLWADPAAQSGCVSCHNAHERTPAVSARRLADGVPTGKQWKLHQLMGALSVTIPLSEQMERADVLALQAGAFFLTMLLASFGLMAWLNRRLVKQQKRVMEQQWMLDKLQAQQDAAESVLKAKSKAERALAELSSLSEAVDEHALVSVTDAHGIIQYVNQKFVDVLGYSRDEVVGQSHFALSGPDVSEDMRKEVRRRLSHGQSWRGVYSTRTRGGEVLWMDASVVPVKDGSNQVLRIITIRVDITDRMRAEQEMLHSATHDALTGLPNRSLLRDRVTQAALSDKRKQMMAALLFIDLDKFKDINDTMGHDAGDELLVEASKRLLGCVREEDTVARQGGDEFIVLMPSINTSMDAAILAEKLIKTMAKPFQIKGQTVHVGTSVGIAIYPDDGHDVDTLLKHSDTAMYRVKETGRNNYMFFTPEMNRDASERYGLESDLRTAMEHGQLLMNYQPVVDAMSGEIVSMEALLRWHHPTRGRVSPAQFIGLAESSGLIIPMGKWVLQTVCRQVMAWRAQGLVVPRVAVNLSAVQFKRGDVYETVHYVLSETGLEPQALSLEITESLLMVQNDITMDTLHRLHRLGVKIAMDDFGTGYSSLSYLKRMPINTLKVDRSFVVDITHDQDDRSIVQTVIAMAHNLKMQVVAEGVETQAQLDFLRSHQCDAWQGYLFSVPLSAEDMALKLRRKA